MDIFDHWIDNALTKQDYQIFITKNERQQRKLISKLCNKRIPMYEKNIDENLLKLQNDSDQQSNKIRNDLLFLQTRIESIKKKYCKK